MNDFFDKLYAKPYRDRQRNINKILENFRDEKYCYMIMGYFIYLPDMIISFLGLEIYKFNGLLDNEKFNKILELIDERIKNNK